MPNIFGGTNGQISFGPLTSSAMVGQMGTWSIDGMSRNTIGHSAFGNDVEFYKPGTLEGGTVSFSGYFMQDSTEQDDLRTYLRDATVITSTYDFRLWESDSTADAGYGFWGLSSSSDRGYVSSYIVNNVALTRDKNGMGTISYQLKVSGYLDYSTSTASTAT